ncbi:MAG TPA: hypothetical protein VGD67_04460 [Pseudonocardiaceae bacterium]
MSTGWPVELDAFLTAVAAGLDRPVLAALDVLGRGDAATVLATLEESRPTVFGEAGFWRLMLHATALNLDWSVVAEVVLTIGRRGWTHEALVVLDAAVRRPVVVAYPIASTVGGDALARLVDAHPVDELARYPTLLLNQAVLLAVAHRTSPADLARCVRLLRAQRTGPGTWGARYLVASCEARPDLPAVATALRAEGRHRDALRLTWRARRRPAGPR